MKIQRLQQVFQEEIKPQLGRIHKEEKYLNIVWQLAESSTANNGKGLREAQLTNEVKPASQALNRLADKGFVEVTLPVGDGTLLVDHINNRRELFKKKEMIDKYFTNFRRHLENNEKVREIAIQVLHLNSQSNLIDWIYSLEEQDNFDQYNLVVFKLLETGIEIRDQYYGPLHWRKMAKYYNISERIKELLED